MHARARERATPHGARAVARPLLTWKSAEVDGLRIRARCGGRTEARSSAAPPPSSSGASSAPPSLPIVLVHGLGVSGRYHERLARRLAPRHVVWIPDLPGHGASDHAEEPLDVPALATALGGWMDAVALGRALLVGHSLGCQVIAELAAREPARAAGLVLVAPTPDPGASTPLQVAMRLLADVPRERPSLVPIVAADYLRAGPEVVTAEYRAMQEHDMRTALEFVRAHMVPSAVVRGGGDPVVGAGWAAEVARLCGAPAPVTLRGVGHAVHHSSPGAIVTVLRALRERIASAARPA